MIPQRLSQSYSRDNRQSTVGVDALPHDVPLRALATPAGLRILSGMVHGGSAPQIRGPSGAPRLETGRGERVGGCADPSKGEMTDDARPRDETLAKPGGTDDPCRAHGLDGAGPIADGDALGDSGRARRPAGGRRRGLARGPAGLRPVERPSWPDGRRRAGSRSTAPPGRPTRPLTSSRASGSTSRGSASR